MSRRSRRRKASASSLFDSQVGREDPYFARSLPRLDPLERFLGVWPSPPLRALDPLYDPAPPQDLREVEDRRLFHPEARQRPAASFDTPRHRLQVVRPTRPSFDPFSVPSRIGFRQPDRVLICVRRQQRKEVLHALHVAGRSGLRRPRRGPYSNVSCRR